MACFILFGCFLWKLEKTTRVEETVLEQFGDYLKILIEENRIEELEPYVISRFISWEEGGEMADWCPAFHHFFVYKEYDFSTIWTDGGILTAADLNGDGIEDVIEYEYVDERYEAYNHAGLMIYLGKEEKDYQITYYQSNFDTNIRYVDSMFVVNYQDGIFLILQKSVPFENRIREMGIYQIQDGILTEELKIQYRVSSIDTEVTYCKEGMEEKAKIFSQNAKEYYMESANEELFQGEAEEHLKEEAEELELLEKLGKEQSEDYKEKYEKDRKLQFLSAGFRSSITSKYHSDLDNDGEEEIYGKADAEILGMMTEGSKYYYRTGEFLGEGKQGLDYILVDGENWVDFETLCGLKIWSGKWIPQIFWVEPWEGKNITFFKYYDENYLIGRIEGYRIQEGSYETVVSVTYYPNYTFEMIKEEKTKEELEQTADYLVCMEKKEGIDVRIPVIHGLSNQELEEKINQNLEKILLENMESYAEGYLFYKGVLSTIYNNMIAAKDYLLFDYTLQGLDIVKRIETVTMFVEIDLKNGEIGLYRDFDMEKEFQIRGNPLDRKNGIPIEKMLLEEFGEYYKTLMEENRMEEMEQYVISRSISLGERKTMADWCLAFHHFSESEEYYEELSDTEEIILIAADLNGDGIEDIIEYVEVKGDTFDGSEDGGYNDAGLAIYLGNEEKDYQVTYYQPDFDTSIRYVDPMVVVNYQNCNFLMLQKEIPFENSDREIAIYQIQEGVLTEKLKIQYEVSSIDTCYSNYTFDMTYEKKTKEELEQIATYWVCIEKKEGIEVSIPVIHGLSDQKLEEKINQNLEKILLKCMEEYVKESNYLETFPVYKITGVVYDNIIATKDYLVFNCELSGLMKINELVLSSWRGSQVRTESAFIEINLKNGEIKVYED